MKEHEIDIYLDGVKTRVDLRKMDYTSLRNLSLKLQPSWVTTTISMR
ncbi:MULTISPECIES: hypothetical protein [Sphingobacterium]|nr:MULTISPECIES: hypothetical protein [Sphingobacterium]QIH36715.1 hypothetical protein G6053_29395 [Sphingobacterium sp. DR205]